MLNGVYLLSYSKNRPAKKDTLLNSIKNKFKDSPDAAAAVFKLLTTQGAVTVVANNVSYSDKKIKELANQSWSYGLILWIVETTGNHIITSLKI